MQNKIYINGKFLAQRLTGVQRFGFETILALDKYLAANGKEHPFVILSPATTATISSPFSAIPIITSAASSLHLWEQFSLPRLARDSVLLNLTGSAPLFRRNQVCTFHDAAVFDFPKAYSKTFGFWYRFLFRIQSRICRGVFTVSDFSRSRLIERLKIPRSRLHVIPNGSEHLLTAATDESILSKHGLIPGSYLLAVGSNNPSKNFPALLSAFHTLNRNSVRLVVVGGNNEGVFAAEKTVFDTNIVRTGRISDAQLKALYIHAKAFVFPSLYEGFGIPSLEAMTLGCPVVASNVAAVVDTCSDAALYFDPRDEDAIVSAMERICDDEKLRSILKIAGIKRAAVFTWQRAAMDLLEGLVGFGIDSRLPTCRRPGDVFEGDKNSSSVMKEFH